MIPDDPVIHSMEMTGYPPWIKNQEEPVCPICGQECERVFKDKTGDIVGCDVCLEECDAVDEEECFPGGYE